MAFVNEYATEEDIEKYRLNELWDRYMARRDMERFFGREPEITIDRERNALLMVAGRGSTNGGTQYQFLMSIRGQVVKVRMNLVEGSSGSFEDRPFFRVWDLANIQKGSSCTVEDSEVIDLLKKAVTAYGYNGAREQIPDTVVKFNF